MNKLVGLLVLFGVALVSSQTCADYNGNGNCYPCTMAGCVYCYGTCTNSAATCPEDPDGGVTVVSITLLLLLLLSFCSNY